MQKAILSSLNMAAYKQRDCVYAAAGKCRYGPANCRSRHPGDAGYGGPAARKIPRDCLYYPGCRMGIACPFRHPDDAGYGAVAGANPGRGRGGGRGRGRGRGGRSRERGGRAGRGGQAVVECSVCQEEVPRRGCVYCLTELHFICPECLNDFVAAMCQSNIPRGVEISGALLCVGRDAEGRACPREIEAKYFKPRVTPETANTYDEALARRRANIQDERRRLEIRAVPPAPGSSADVRATWLQHQVEDLDLCNIAPCGHRFDFFDGCFAVTCHGDGTRTCGRAFCGFCMQDCGADAHPHVRECPLNPFRVSSFSNSI